MMKKVSKNFWVDLLLFIDFIGLVSTGVLLHRFPGELSHLSLLGIPRYEWGNFHWMLSQFFILLSGIHLILHWNWTKAGCQKYLKMGPTTLIIIVIMAIIIFGIILPTYLTKDLPDKQEIREKYRNTGTVEVAPQE